MASADDQGVRVLRIISYAKYGDPDDVIEIVEKPSPQPGPDEVVIALEAAPVHLADIKNITGQPWFRADLPATPGYEGVGRIKAAGKAVTRFREGDRVFLPIGFGSWREELVASANDVWSAPEGVPAEQLALISINLQTAYLMLKEARLAPGDWVIQNAANSNVGYYVIRLARHMGLRTINVVRREELFAGLLDAGADHALLDGDGLSEAVADITGNVRLAIDAVAGAATARLAACLGEGGHVTNYGFLTGDVCELSSQQMMFRGLTFSGFFTKGSIARMAQKDVDEMRDHLSEFMVTDASVAPIAGVYEFAQVRNALAHAARTGDDRRGKVVLVP